MTRADASMLSRTAARASMGAAALSLLALAALHGLSPGLSPASHMISEYALGPFGWLMTVSFGAFAASSASLCVALVQSARSLLARVGLGFLALAAVGLAIGGAFSMDPVPTPPEAMSFAGRMHGVGFMIGVPGELLSVLLLSLALRKQAPWASSRLLTITAALWLSVAVMGPLIATQTPFFGIPNRTFMVSFAVWLVLVARPMASQHRAG